MSGSRKIGQGGIRPAGKGPADEPGGKIGPGSAGKLRFLKLAKAGADGDAQQAEGAAGALAGQPGQAANPPPLGLNPKGLGGAAGPAPTKKTEAGRPGRKVVGVAGGIDVAPALRGEDDKKPKARAGGARAAGVLPAGGLKDKGGRDKRKPGKIPPGPPS